MKLRTWISQFKLSFYFVLISYHIALAISISSDSSSRFYRASEMRCWYIIATHVNNNDIISLFDSDCTIARYWSALPCSDMDLKIGLSLLTVKAGNHPFFFLIFLESRLWSQILFKLPEFNHGKLEYHISEYWKYIWKNIGFLNKTYI